MAKSKDTIFGRRRFLKGAATGGVVTLLAGAEAVTAPPAKALADAKLSVTPQEVNLTGTGEVLTTNRPGSDFMVDVIKSLGFEYVAANPGSTFRGLHESLINYGGNQAPELITCCHEESSVGIAHGYADVEGKPMLVLIHSTVGLQHASMAIYNAWAGEAPVYMLIANTIDATVQQLIYHAAQDVTSMVRGFTKWDDAPISLAQFAESGVRAYKIAMSLPRAPVAVVIDTELQEKPIPEGSRLHIPKIKLDTSPQADSGSVDEIAKLLVNAENPVIIAGRITRSQESMDKFAELVEAIQVPVMDQGANLPTHHPLNQQGNRGLVSNADVILALDAESLFPGNLWGFLHSRQGTRPGAKLITMSVKDTYVKGDYQHLPRYVEPDLSVAADPEITLPVLTEAVKKLVSDDRRGVFEQRSKKFAEAQHTMWEQARRDAVYGWDSSPVSLTRLSAEVWAQVKNEDWATATGGTIDEGLPGALGFDWKCVKHYQRTNNASAIGIGFRAPSALGSALAHRKHGRFFVYLQSDGDLMYAPGVLWTAAHHRIPFLAVMHNNRAYHQETMHVQRMCSVRQRGVDRAGIGTRLEDPNLDFAKIAQGMGIYAEGPISNPNDLAPAIKRAIAVVKGGEPALLDVVSQPR